MKKTIEELMEGRQSRRMKEENRFMEKLMRREANAEKLVGELTRDGKTVYYISPVGGRYREGDKYDLIAFLIRNGYA